MVFVNLTPHDVTVYGDDDAVVLSIPPSGKIARLPEHVSPLGVLDNTIPRVAVTFSLAQDDMASDVVPGTYYIVSLPYLMALVATGLARPDCLYPFGQVRDEQGRIIGCRALASIGQ